jgi:hypothetical protein
VALGALAVAALPVAVVSAWLLKRVSLLRATEVAVPAAFVLGFAAVALVRRARYRVDRSVRRLGDRSVRVGRVLAWAGLYLAVTGAVALGFYGLLVLRG